MRVRMDASVLVKSLANVTDNLPKQLAIVANKVATKTKSLIAKDVSSRVAVKQKVVKRLIKTKRIGKTKRIVQLAKSKRIPLRDFGAKQTKTGVSYKIDKAQSRKTIPGAFQGPAPGRYYAKWKGRVFKRQGRSRLPIYQLFGPSPWGVFVKNKRKKHVANDASAELKKQLAERIRYLTLKKSGAI